MANLLTPFASNPKTIKKCEEYGIEGALLHLLPADGCSATLGRNVTVCPMAERNGCKGACLGHQGRGRMSNVRKGRERKTLLYFEQRGEFMRQLRNELSNLQARAEKKGRKAVARLDGTSDIGLAEKIAAEFPEITFYDYTKVEARMRRQLRRRVSNYHLTFSRGAGNEQEALELLEAGTNVTVVFRLRKGGQLPQEWQGYAVLDGDVHDFRFMDSQGGYVIGLRSKGTSYRDQSGFIVDA